MRLYNFFDDIEVCAKALTGDYSLKFVWRELPPNMGAGYDFITNTILMPKVNIYDLDSRMIRKLRAFSYHERLHHALSDFEPVKKAGGFDIDPQTKKPIAIAPDPNSKIKPGEFLKTLLNFLEDCRIEQNEHYRLPGDIEDTLWYRTKVDYPEYLDKWNDLQTFNPWGSLMANLQFRICNYGKFPIDESLQKYFDLAWNILNDGRYHQSLKMKQEGTFVMLQLAEEIAEAWNIEFDKDEEMQNRCKNNQNEGKEIKPNQKIKNQHIKIKPLKDGESPTNLTNVEFENCTFEIEEIFEEDQSKEEEKYSINPDKLNQEMANLAREEKTEENSNSVNPSQCLRKPHNDDDDNKNIEELPKRMDPYVPYNIQDQIIVAKKNKQKYDEAKKQIKDKILVMKFELSKILVAQKRNGIERDLKHGLIDPANLHKVIKGNPRIFARHIKGVKTKPAVQLVIDLSGSMKGEKIILATQIATLFAEILETIKVPFEIIGFNSLSPSNQDSQKAIEGGYDLYHDRVIKWIFKEFKEPFSLVKERLGSCCNSLKYSDELTPQNYISGAVGGANVDHEVILWGAKRLAMQESDKRIQIVLSDGLPNGCGNYGDLLPKMLLKINKKITKAGIYQFAFGIKCEDVCHYYDHHKHIKDLDNFNLEAIKCLASLLIRKNNK